MTTPFSFRQIRQVDLRKLPWLLLATAVTGLLLLPKYIESFLPVFFLSIAASALTKRKANARHHYGIAAVVILLFCYWFPMSTVLYFGWAFAMLYGIELRGFRFGMLSLTALIVSSPVFSYAINAFSFPVRLQLTQWVAHLFAMAGTEVKSAGSIIFFEGKEYSVDPACMGLHMLTVSMLVGIALIGLLQTKLVKRLSFLFSWIFLLSILVFNLLSNLLRMVMLIMLDILPDNTSHDLVGLLCLLCYVCFPAAFLGRWMVNRFGRDVVEDVVSVQRSKGVAVVLPVLLCVAGLYIAKVDTYQNVKAAGKQSVEGFSNSQATPGVLKLESSTALVYVKFLRGFFDTEHHPMICWKGSGYSFENVRLMSTKAGSVYVARLSNGKDQLYTAWWNGNGQKATVDQWTWRKDMLFGSPTYAVINVTASSAAALESVILELKGTSKLQPVFAALDND